MHLPSDVDTSHEVASNKEPMTEWSPCEYCFSLTLQTALP